VRASIIVAVVGLTLLAGCGAAADDPRTLARRAKPSPSAATASTAPALERDAVAARARAAVPKPDAYRSLGLPSTYEREEYDDSYATTDACNMTVVGENKLSHVAHAVTWQASNLFLSHLVHGYTRLAGKDAVEAVRRNATNCTTWTVRYTDGEATFTAIETFDVGPVTAGAEASYAACYRELFTDSGNEWVYCTAYVAKGPLVARVSLTTYDKGTSTARARAKLNQALPVAVAALAAA